MKKETKDTQSQHRKILSENSKCKQMLSLKKYIYYPRLVIPKENPSELAYVQSSERIKVESSILFCVNIKYVQKYFNELM